MVLVPRKRYEMLIEIYAVNMADASAKEFRTHLESKLLAKKEDEADGKGDVVEEKEEKEESYKEKYENIVQGGDLELSSLKIFF